MITNSRIAWGDSLGAQLTSLAALMYIGFQTDQQVVFYDELRSLRRGMQFLDVFDIDDVSIVSRCNGMFSYLVNQYGSQYKRIHGWKRQMSRIYHGHIFSRIDDFLYKRVIRHYSDFLVIDSIKNSTYTDLSLLSLDKSKNYDIQSGYGTYRDWGKEAKRIIGRIHFKPDIMALGEEALKTISSAVETGKKTVSIHFRLCDYLVLSSLNLSEEYYSKAMRFFPDSEYCYLVFSDEIEKCKHMKFFEKKDVIFMEPREAPLDLFLMSKCDSNIVANSSFSVWGALLNDNPQKKVVCPHDYIGESAKELSFINGNYYPDSWIAI